jgi:23S rRNA pseudouridine2604 synthase
MRDEGERLAKRVAALVPCSRREAEQYITGGWVSVDGRVVEEPQSRVQQQVVTLDRDASLLDATSATLLLHKPAGHDDGRLAPDGQRQRPGGPTPARQLLTQARQLVSDEASQRLLKRHLVGLDSPVPLESGASGLLVFTQDWRVARKLQEDAALIEHEVMVEVAGDVSPETLRRLNRTPQGAAAARASVKISLNSNNEVSSRLRCAIKGGQAGLLADLFDQAGLQMTGMKRIRIGRVMLGALPPGQWRFLFAHERF